MRVEVDNAVCAATGACVQVCPDVFALEGGTVQLLRHDPADALAAQVRLAAELCPTGAIRVET